MEDCIFCKIVSGEIPSNKIHESDHVYAFMDISPISKGHCLFIPKVHAEKMHEVADETLSEILIMIKQVINAGVFENYNVLQNNGIIAHQEVKHAHWHLIPKEHSDEGLKLEWKPNKEIEQTRIADKIRANLLFEFE